MTDARRFRKKPEFVTAIQYDGTVESAVACQLKGHPTAHRPYIDDDHGVRTFVDKGDWVVADEAGLQTTYSSDGFWDAFEEVL